MRAAGNLLRYRNRLAKRRFRRLDKEMPHAKVQHQIQNASLHIRTAMGDDKSSGSATQCCRGLTKT
jgi:hypothetical protein